MPSRKRSQNATQDQIEGLLELVRGGNYPCAAARKVGISRSALSMRKKRDPEFLEQLEAAEAEAECKLVADVYGDKDWRAKMGILERRWPERWAKPETRAQMGGGSASADEVVKGLQAFFQEAEKRHNPPGAEDVDAEPEASEQAEEVAEQ
jgi:hypothetical protein